MDQDDARQVLHVTYGFILRGEDESLRNDFFETLWNYENEYYELLIRHFGKHLAKLGVISA